MLGLCRFSYLGLRGFQIDHATREDRRAFLYDPGRLKRRWFWFRHIALPGWLAQSDPDFTLVVMTGPDLPEPYLSRLRALAERHPQIALSEVAPMDHHLPACLAAVTPHLDPAADVIGHFRHDDDDAVALDYIARARADFATVEPLYRREGALCLDHAQGVMADVRGGAPRLWSRICHNATAAMAIFLPPDLPRTAIHYEHWRLARWMPNVQISDSPMYLRLLHGDSDSNASAGGGFDLPDQPSDWPGLLTSRFAIDERKLVQGARRQAGPAGADATTGR